MKKLLGVIVGAVLTTAVVGGAPVHAADLTIPLDTVIVSGVTAGTQVELAVASSGPLAGQTCAVRSVHRGAGEAHPGNDLRVTSGQQTSTLTDVEREPGGVTDGAPALTLADVVVVELVMGPDEAFGGDIDIELDCGPAAAAAAEPGARTLPATGDETRIVALLGLVLLAAGTALVLLARSNPTARREADPA